MLREASRMVNAQADGPGGLRRRPSGCSQPWAGCGCCAARASA